MDLGEIVILTDLPDARHQRYRTSTVKRHQVGRRMIDGEVMEAVKEWGKLLEFTEEQCLAVEEFSQHQIRSFLLSLMDIHLS